MSDFRETLYTVDKEGHRRWVYSSVLKGYFYKRRSVVAAVLIIIYLLTPWITVGNEQAVLLDIANRKFTFFGTTLWATDTTVLALTLITLGLSLFFFTAVLGRVWCGWACPETVFLEFIFRPIETMIEGSPAQRQRLDLGPWTAAKLFKKGLKYFCFLVVCWLLSNTALAYFFGTDSLVKMIQHSPLDNLSPFLVQFFLIAALMFQFGWFREQFCTVVCPYARFQSVLMDQNSLLVGYDTIRGEPRSKPSKHSENPAGDCIDCGLCLRVCPTGIDIRNGTQLECIHCANCVDACDSIMRKSGKPEGLIRYDTESRFEGSKTKFVRPRIVVYAALITLVVGALCANLLLRDMSDSQIIRGAHDEPFSAVGNGKITNHLRLHLANKSGEVEEYSVRVLAPEGVSLIVPADPFPVQAGEEATLPLFFTFDEKLLVNGRLQVSVRVSGKQGYDKVRTATLLGPG